MLNPLRKDQPVPLREVHPWELYDAAKRRVFLSVLFLVGVLNNADKNVIGVLLEQIKAEFKTTDTLLGLLSGLFFALFYVAFGIPIARWADRGNRKHILTLSVLIWSAMTTLCGCVTAFWQLALARFGVGAGEAGAVPPSQSLIADYYSPTQRARAIGVLLLSSSVGNAIGLMLGGFLAQHYGWRRAFIVIGLCGVVTAPLVHVVLKEPRRIAPFGVAPKDYEAIRTGIRVLLDKRTYRHTLIAYVLLQVMAYGAIVFVVSAMIRIHGLSVAQAGAAFGALSAFGAVIGNLLGGMLGDKLVARDLGLGPKMTGWAMILGVVTTELAFASAGVVPMAILLFVSITILNAALPTMFSTLHAVCGSKRRATSVALVYLCGNLIGLGFGPVLTGWLSDRLGSLYGAAEGLRQSLMLVTFALLPAGWLMLRAQRFVAVEAEA